jgi:hypothetical protein
MTPIPLKRVLLHLLIICSGFALQAEVYVVVPLGSMGYTKDRINELNLPISPSAWTYEQALRFPDLRFEDDRVEAYIAFPEQEDPNGNLIFRGNENQSQLNVALRLPGKDPINGQAVLTQSGGPSKVAHAFTFDPGLFEEVTPEAFEKIRRLHYARLATSPVPGGDWFRYRAGDGYRADPRTGRGRNFGAFDSSFNLFTGHRAVSENLALDRELILGTSEKEQPVNVSTITGVTVAPIDWAERITDAPTPIDPLALHIPHDQHAAFFGSIKDLNQSIRTVEQEGMQFFQTQSNRNVYQGLAQKYQKQMGLLIPDLLAENAPIKSVAVTGGDPFLPSGSDVCVLFETDAPEALMVFLNALIHAQAELNGAPNPAKTEIDGVTCSVSMSGDRDFSSILFAGKNYVAVTNSRHQLLALTAVANGETVALGTTEEFTFFRQRYPLAEKTTAFIFLSDAAIRRWASPAFRIGASRRVRAAAALGQATAQTLDGKELKQTYADLVGELRQNGSHIRSEIFNTLDFLTPISELDLTTVTTAEKEGYERWRRGYESGWVRFDPIALSLSIDDVTLGMDLSVIPLRVSSRYNQWLAIAGEAELDPVALHAHPESILMLSYAIDGSSEMFQMANTQSSAMLPGIGANPLAWVGGSLSFFLDSDPFWEEMNASEDPEDFIADNMARLPIGLRVSSKSPMKLALFLTTLRSFSEQAAPGLLVWETREHENTPYVVIKTTERAGLPNELEIKAYYAALPNAFLLSLSEDLLKRAITRNGTEPEAPKPEPGADPYQAFAQLKIQTLQSYLNLVGEDPLRKQQIISWAALPILNEWHQRYPGEDPVKAYARDFGDRIQCPGGRGYQWNPEIGGMESVEFGSPEASRGTPMKIPLFENRSEAKAAVSLQENELRVKAELTK